MFFSLLFFLNSSFPYQFNNYLCPLNWCLLFWSRQRMKRESGANPEQSRCCEAPFNSPEITSLPLKGLAFREGSGKGVSQKTCQCSEVNTPPGLGELTHGK